MRNSQTTRQTQPPQRQRGCRGCFGRVLLLGLLFFAFVVFSGVGVAALVLSSNLTGELEEGIARLDDARNRESFETTLIRDRNGATLWEIFGEGKRTQVALNRIPPALREATISVEDDTFYRNKGFDEPSLIAAVIANVRNRDGRPVGGSTITQQLVRHIAFDYEERVSVSYRRKLKELFLAWRMTQDFSKDEILEMYLNEIYYGNLAYGVEAASRSYFDKPVESLTLGEAALLAGLPQAPVERDPYTNFEGAKERQWMVLTLMVEDGVITMEQANLAYLEPIVLAAQEVSLNAPHFAVYVRQQLEAMFGAEQVANGGLRVTTTLDMRYQRLAEQQARAQIDALRAQNVSNAALVALKPATGEILAMLGSVNYHDEAIDGAVNITLTPQQPGSTFKPLTYAAALSPDVESGVARWSPADLLWDVPVAYEQFDGGVYAPVNYDEQFHGPMRMRTALANSYNIPAVLLAQDLSVERLLQLAQQMGIASLGDDASRYGLSLTLGGGEVTPLEMTTAYAVFANEGKRVDPVAILEVTNSRGELMFRHEPSPAQPVLDSRVAFLISDFLDDDAARTAAMGVDNPLALPFPAAVKTGTTNDFRDNWTIGYTPSLVVTIWTGNSDNSPMLNVSGLTGAAPLLASYMQAVYAEAALVEQLAVDGLPAARDFRPAAGLTRLSLCRLDSVLPQAETCDRSQSEWVLEEAARPEATTAASGAAIWEQIEPAVARILSAPQLGDGQRQQRYCRVGEGRWPAETQARLFLMPPRNAESLEAALQWAEEHGVALAPQEACTGDAAAELVVVTPEWPTATPPPPVVTQPPTEAPALPRPPQNTPVAGGLFYRIDQPAPGQTVTGVAPIVGSAVFDAAVVQFYKLELRNAKRDEWVTLGTTHAQPVTQGQLESLSAEALARSEQWGPGSYELRLVLVTWDGNYVGPPYTVMFRIGE